MGVRVSDIIDAICKQMDGMEASGRRCARLLLGHREADELERALYQPAKTWRGLFGEPLFHDEEYAPKLPYPLTERVEIFGVPVERVDQPTLLGVIGEDQA